MTLRSFLAATASWLGFGPAPAPAPAVDPAPAGPTRKISDEVVSRSKRGAPAKMLNPFAVDAKLHPPREGGADLAMDSAQGVAEWAAAAINGMFAEGQAFLGYPVLAEMAQRPEYRRISETLAHHMTRKWITLQAKGEQDKSEKISQLNDAMAALGLKEAFQKAAEQDGFFGRGHIYVDLGVTENADELKKPIVDAKGVVTPAKVGKGKLQAFRAVEAVWCYPTNYNSNDPLRADWYKPSGWFVMGKQTHASRLLTFVGREVPDLLKPAYSFGGLSLTQMCKPYVDNWLKTRQSVADIISAFSVFVLKTNMVDVLSAAGDDFFKRLELFNNVRRNSGVMAIDKNEEDFANVSAPLGTLDTLQAQTQEHMAAVSGIPIVFLLGLSPAGLNASSEGEIMAFYDWVNGLQEKNFRPNLTVALNIIQIHLFGQIDPDIIFEFTKLWALNEKELSEKQNKDADTDSRLIDAGVLDPLDSRKRWANDPTTPYQGLDADSVPLPPPGEEDDAEADEPPKPEAKAA